MKQRNGGTQSQSTHHIHYRQLERVFEHRESLKNENSSLKENLNNEIQVQRDLQRRLNEAQSSETDAIRLKEQVLVT